MTKKQAAELQWCLKTLGVIEPKVTALERSMLLKNNSSDAVLIGTAINVQAVEANNYTIAFNLLKKHANSIELKSLETIFLKAVKSIQ